MVAPRSSSSKSSHHTSEWKPGSSRRSTSALHGILELQNSLRGEESDEENKPKRRSRTETVDGRKVTFALMRDVTQPPKVSRKERLQSDWRNVNVKQNSAFKRAEHEIQQYLMGKSIPKLTFFYLLVFLFMNAFFAAFWNVTEEKCCGDPEMGFAQIFDFSVQTSSTIGYGSYHPEGYFNNALVVLITVLSICQATVYAGLLFFRFITPHCNIHFSDVITMSNVLGTPCFEIRIGNADGKSNKLINVDAALCVTSVQDYVDPDDHTPRRVVQTEDLHLAVSSQHKLNGVWTIRHYVDEKSPLYGFRFDEYPGKAIYSIQLSVKAVQAVTKGEVYSQTAYQIHDIMVGHRFVDMAIWDAKTRKGFFDYSKMSKTQPSYVWYPVQNSGLSTRNLPIGEISENTEFEASAIFEVSEVGSGELKESAIVTSEDFDIRNEDETMKA